jgi:hypothetical protein
MLQSRPAGYRRHMAKDNGNGNGRASEERYRQAATEALEMLDWCIGFLVGIRKESIASQLAKNRKHIREDLMNEPAEPVPTSKD